VKSTICTLFEKHYHYGTAALVNSLYHHGYRGDIYAGYRGSLPFWTAKAKENPLLGEGICSLEVAAGLNIHFILLDIKYHLTNYKPNFMLHLLDGPAKGAESIAYFDPDITIKCRWNFFESWMSHGVALVHEITANDMPPTHPIRKEWEKVICLCNKITSRELYSYINAGFCGVSRQNLEFLQVWQEIFEKGISSFKIDTKQLAHQKDRTHVFYAQDQDSLNMAAMCSKSPISEIGPEGMDFIHGGWLMSHAVGSPKPWKKNFLLSMLKGISPSLADKAYWRNVSGPIQCYNLIKVKFKKANILLASFVGRFYSKN
jgi:hypothetical protein